MSLSFLDHIINGTDVHFDSYGKIVLAMVGLVPSLIAENDASVIDILDIYIDDLPSPLNFNDEVIHWKRRWTASEVSAQPDTITKAIKNVTMKRIKIYQFFLRLRVLLQLLNANVSDQEVYLIV